MSQFLDITLTNYGSFFGTHSFRLADRGLCLILGDNRDDPRMNSNAAGKSMIPDALDWCLFGEVPRDDVADSIINEKAKRGTEVTTRVRLDDGVVLKIIRRRKVKGEKSGVRFWVGGEEKTTPDVAESQRRLDNYLGMDRSVFHSAVLFAQFDEWKFADATDAQRKALLSKIIPELAVVDEWLVHAKARAAEVADEAFAAGEKARGQQIALDSLRNNDPRPLAAEWEGQKAQALETLRTKAHEYANGLQALTTEMQANPFTQVPSAPLAAPEAVQVAADLELVAGAVNLAFQKQGEAQGHATSLKTAAAAAAASGTCPTCGQAVTADCPPPEQAHADAQRMLDHAAHELAQARDQVQMFQTQVNSLAANHQVQTQQHQAYVQSIAPQNERYNRLVARHDEVQKELAGFQLQVQQAEANQIPNPYDERVNAWLQTWETTSAELNAATQAAAHLDSQLPYYKFWVDAFGPRGIKSHILDSRLQEMTDEANRWVSLLTGGTIWVRFETQSKTGKGKTEKLVDKFSVRVFRHNPDNSQTDRNYRSWCGGEKARVGSGVDFGLARLVANRAAQSYDILFLDEIFGKHLDQAGKEAVAEMLQQLAAEKSSIFVIDHDPRFQGTFAETVVVQKVNGESTILEASK
jgi:DNA repair exonuclease SbcCD ATPase subunit